MESTFLTQPFSVFFIEVDACETNRLCKCYFSRRKIYVVQNVVEKSFKLLIFIVIAENEKASLSFRCQAKQIASDGIALSFLCRLFYKLKEQLQGYCAIWIATLNTNSALCTAPWLLSSVQNLEGCNAVKLCFKSSYILYQSGLPCFYHFHHCCFLHVYVPYFGFSLLLAIQLLLFFVVLVNQHFGLYIQLLWRPFG
uniref:Uncharacterized protein LOC114914462 n=1 Tax=Elaeis guineensis var. tenera TaxID=51953 RepID=A0A8N4I9Z3_ELAGV|nr:uncharacterized protein LOC114914462 [Elaeis guineensis]